MSTYAHVPKHNPNMGSCVSASSPTLLQLWPTPQLSNTTTESHAADSQELLFCLLPQAIPKQWELNIYKAVTVCLMFNLVLGSLMLRIAEVTADYTTGGAWCTRLPDSYQDGLSPLQASCRSCFLPLHCAPGFSECLNFLSCPVFMNKEKTNLVTKSYWICMC